MLYRWYYTISILLVIMDKDKDLPVSMMMVSVGVGGRGPGRVGLVVHRTIVIGALGRGAEIRASATDEDHPVGGARGARRRLEKRLFDVCVGLHVAAVCRRRP